MPHPVAGVEGGGHPSRVFGRGLGLAQTWICAGVELGVGGSVCPGARNTLSMLVSRGGSCCCCARHYEIGRSIVVSVQFIISLCTFWCCCARRYVKSSHYVVSGLYYQGPSCYSIRPCFQESKFYHEYRRCVWVGEGALFV